MRKQLLIPSVIGLVLVALLAGMITWRLDNAVVRSQWIGLVEAAPAQVSDSQEALGLAEEILAKAEAASFTGNRYQSVAILVDETSEALSEMEGLLGYLEDAPVVEEGPLASAVDPLSMGNRMEPAEQVVVVPGDFKVELPHYTATAERVKFSTDKLRTATEDLQAGLKDIVKIRAEQEVWETERVAVSKALRKARETLTAVEVVLPSDVGNATEELAKEVQAAEDLLKDHSQAPDNLDDLTAQIEQFKAAKRELGKARRVAERAAEEAAAELELLEYLAAVEAQDQYEDSLIEETFAEEEVPSSPEDGQGDYWEGEADVEIDDELPDNTQDDTDLTPPTEDEEVEGDDDADDNDEEEERPPLSESTED